MPDLVKFWYVSSQRLCNFECRYCVSIGDYSKSGKYDWKREQDRTDFEQIVQWIGSRPFEVAVRLATLGEPFASNDFLAQAAWLTRQPGVRFVELLTNGSLLKRRLSRIAADGDISKLSIWVTHHPTEISVERLIENAIEAQETYGCFTVVNALLFEDNTEEVEELRNAAQRAGLRFNVDIGYDPGTAIGLHERASQMAPILRLEDGPDRMIRMGARPELLGVNLLALDDVRNQPCAAGHDYFYIGIDGDIYPCSRYYVLKRDRLGNVLDPGFELMPRGERWARCQARSGCCNKEDFLNLRAWSEGRSVTSPSLGWVEA